MEGEDQFSKLPDDMLLCILEKANIITAVRASFLSTRWRQLPACLSHINLDVWDFIPLVSTSTNHIVDEAMSALIKAARICLAGPARANTMKTVNLQLYLTVSCFYDIVELVRQVIDNNKVLSVGLDLLTEKTSRDCDVMDMFQHKKTLIRLFDTVPNMFGCLTKLFLYNIRFEEPELHRFLNCCQQLQHLYLHNCDTGIGSVLMLDMPDSKISCLELDRCCFENIELVCLPKLAEFHCESWISLNAPFSFGYVPFLENVRLACDAAKYQPGLYLSDLLHGTTEVHALTLNFLGEKIWVLQEGMKLCTSFNKLTEMSINGIYVQFGLSWTIGLLETAPSLKTFRIKVWDHVCDLDERSRRVYSKRTNPWVQKDKLKRRHFQLTRFEFSGFMTVKKHTHFVRTVINYAPNLETILLKDKYRCKSCDAVNKSSPASLFPNTEFKKGIIRRRLGVGTSCSVQIIFK